jgi:phosphonate transport system substrate-binding protein
MGLQEHEMLQRTTFPILSVLVALGCSEDGTRLLRAQGNISENTCEDGTLVPEKLRFGTAGYWAGIKKVESFSALADTLSRAVGIPVEVEVFDNYESLVAALEAGELEMALLPPLAYVQAKAKMRCLRPLRSIVVSGHVMYRGYVMVRNDGLIVTPKDLKGKRLALVERWSSSGYLFPMAWLMSSNLHPTQDLGSIVFTKSHDECIKAVLEGQTDACGTFEGALEKARRQGLPVQRLKVLGITGRIPNDAVVVHPKVSNTVRDNIDKALDRLNTTTPEGRLALAPLLDITGFALTDDQFYDPVRVVLKKVSILGLGLE